MKKLFTLIAAAMTVLSAQATDYTTKLVVKIYGSVQFSEDKTVSVTEQSDGNYTLNLKNFILPNVMNVGTINVENVKGIKCGNVTVLNTAQSIYIQNGDDSSVDSWYGPALGDVPITLLGEIKGESLKALLNISFGGMDIAVELGEGIESLGQLPNAGFSEFHTATYSNKTSQEPNGWHSFMSATGSLVGQVAGAAHTFTSTETAPSSKDGKSVQVKSTVGKVAVLTYSANGTITTGRLKAGSITASNADNCSFSDLTSTDVDANSDPFYTVLTQKPDAMKVWLKYKVGGGNGNTTTSARRATVSAIINDGTYVQDPEKTDYSSSIIARASNTDIASNNEAWQELTLPFTYTESDAQPKAILVTMSTCSVASGGSTVSNSPDILTVDSVQLVYNCSLQSLTYKGQTVTFDASNFASIDVNGTFSLSDLQLTTDAAGAYTSYKVTTSEDYDDDGNPIEVTNLAIAITSGDLKNAKTYNVTLNNADVSGIEKTVVAPAQTSTDVKIYNAAGQRISSLQRGLNIIVKDGKTIKMMKR